MKTICVALVVGAFLMAHSHALADRGCADINTQSGINKCANANYAHADGAMQAVYDRLQRQSDSDGKERLRNAQRAWIAFRDNWCRYVSRQTEGGSMHPSVVATCLIKLTQEQTERLTYQLTCNSDTDCANEL